MWLFVPPFPNWSREPYSEESQKMPVVVRALLYSSDGIDAFGALWAQTYAILPNSCVQQERKEGREVYRRSKQFAWLFDAS